jgi:PEP-CTERM motif
MANLWYGSCWCLEQSRTYDRVNPSADIEEHLLMSKGTLLAGVAAVALAAVSIPARADNIVGNQWYTGHFTGSNTPLLQSGFAGGLGTNGPILPPPSVGNALPAPGAGGLLSAVITVPGNGGYLTVTDVEVSGDQFQMFVNGAPAALAAAGASGLVPPGQASYNGVDITGGTLNGLTSLPVPNAATGCGVGMAENISACLANADYSSGTFYLPPGLDTITGEFLGVIKNGDMDLIVEPTPEPATLSLLGVGLAGLGLARRRRKRAATG